MTRTKTLGAALLLGTILAGGWLLIAETRGISTPIPVIAAAYQEAPSPKPTLPAVSPVTITADATRTAPADAEALRGLTDGITTLLGETPEAVPDAEAEKPAWFLWGHLDAARIEAEARPAESVRIYAARFAGGATLCAQNLTAQKMPLIAQIRLPRGVYKIERLNGTPSSAEESALPAEMRLERLQGRDLAANGLITKRIALEPGQVCLLRYTNVARTAWAARSEARRRLHDLAVTAPIPAKKLRRILNEAEPYFGGLTAPRVRPNLTRRLNSIHRLLLLTAQAQSLHHNYQIRRKVHKDAGTAVMDALERLDSSLAEISAILLGLVPQVEIRVVEEEDRPQATTAALLAAAPVLVTISLANAGPRSVGLVKIGLDSETLPSGVQCEPADPAVFDALRPGQTARATFRLRSSDGTPVAAALSTGDVSYFTAGAAAHLRPSLWSFASR